jgi:uncharacterized membrane protein YqjE
MNENPPSTGFVTALRQLGDGLLASVQDRVQLLSLDVHEEKVRLLQIHVWTSVALFTGMLAVMLASLTLVYLFWDHARLAVLGSLTALYAGSCVAIIVALRRMMNRHPRPFAATLAELESDRACLRPKS